MGPRQIFWVSRDPPTMVCPGAGGWRAISRPKTELQYHIVSCSNGGVLTVGSTRDGDRERAEVANHIYAQRTPLQMSHEASSILDFIRPGDVLIVVKLDRLGRNTRDVLNLVHELEEKGASLRVLEPAIDTGGPMGRMVLTVLGMVAEMELGFIRDRQRAGIDAAKAKGIYKGRPVTFDRARIVSLRKEGMGATEIAKAVGCKRGNVYKTLKAAGLN